jgi:hypothetical protein
VIDNNSFSKFNRYMIKFNIKQGQVEGFAGHAYNTTYTQVGVNYKYLIRFGKRIIFKRPPDKRYVPRMDPNTVARARVDFRGGHFALGCRELTNLCYTISLRHGGLAPARDTVIAAALPLNVSTERI